MKMDPHGFCYLWNTGLIALHVISDFVIGIAYVTIAATLYTLAHVFRDQLRSTGATPYFHLFGAFIFLCALTHYMAVLTVYLAWYWFEGAIKALTAVVSALTAVMLCVFLRRLVQQRVKVAVPKDPA
jgi:hypothetical protein